MGARFDNCREPSHLDRLNAAAQSAPDEQTESRSARWAVLWGGIRRQRSAQESSVSRPAHDLSFVENQLAPKNGLKRPARDLEAFPRGVVRAVMQDLLANGLLALR